VRSVFSPPICSQHLPVDPSSGWTGQKRDHVGDVFGLPEPLERWELSELVDLRLCLALQEQLRGDRAGRDRIDRDLAAAELVCKYVNQALHAGFRGDIRAVAGKRSRDYAARKRDDAATFRDMLGGLCEHDEAFSQVRGELLSFRTPCPVPVPPSRKFLAVRDYGRRVAGGHAGETNFWVKSG
jgi:hypothetical protein